ncbi:MAG TPA: PLP-dependent aminotransferase family protein [Steroidobacteraceae bacterium]|nr:PLP-dependent aminotransferase family protein [Steroidobacteraceae bacterium]
MQLQLDAAAGEPLFLQISRAITGDIQRGRLRPGARLPGTRTLARSLDVHRNTVIAAYAELIAEGWIESSRASGTFVARSLPTVRPRRFTATNAGTRARPARPGFELRGPTPVVDPRARAGVMMMVGGMPDVRLAPIKELARAYGRVLRKHASEVLTYTDPYGHPLLRAQLASMLAASRGLATEPEDVLVTRGSQMALDLAARALIEPGDVVAVEALGYRLAWEAFRRRGAKLVPLPVDEQGLDVAALQQLAERTPVRAVLVTPHHHYPTNVTMSASRRVALLTLAHRKGFAIIEDDYDHEFHFEGRPVLPLASADTAGVVVYIGSLSKILAPGVRIGYMVAPRALIDRLAEHRLYIDQQGDRAVELAVAQLLEDGTVQRCARRARRIYHARRDVLGEQLQRRFGELLSFKLPVGSMAIWAKVAPGLDCERWAAAALERNVAIRPGRYFAFDGRSRPFVRLGFAALDERELSEGVKRLAQAANAVGVSL